MRFFNTAGPVNCDDHYCLPPLDRFDLEKVLSLIDQKKYFVLHAPRQTGKTSCLLALMDFLNREGKYKCLYTNVESAQASRENITEGMRCILSEMASRSRFEIDDPYLHENWYEVFKKSGTGSLNEVLSLWSEESAKPIVLLIDEIDSLVGDTLISVLRQLRSGYDRRPKGFPQSIILCGVRDVRDYRIHSEKEKSVITGGSAFNIKAESLRLGDFSREEMTSLCQYHTAETGQQFDPEALDAIWEYTEGQPWLVNALAYEVCFRMKESRDRNIQVTAEMAHRAKENLILRRETHLDQLADKLTEERVRRVVGPILSGENLALSFLKDDIGYVADLGLIKQQTNGAVRIANRIYKEVIPRELIWDIQSGMSIKSAWFIDKSGRLDMMKLMASFQDFFRQHSEAWSQRFQYREAGPQLLMQAFLQRIVNSGGSVEREYGLGRMRTDLFVAWNHGTGVQKIVIELKILYRSLEKTEEAGLRQTFEYMDKCGADEGHLVIFDRDEKKTWDDKIFSKEEIVKNKKIMIWGM